jgi:Rrf2 family nitric oxide-sensitive transcriptional repressor
MFVHVFPARLSEGAFAMKLTRYTDYALRVLLYVGTRPDRLSSIGEISRAYGISQNHLMKVVNDLANAGYVASVRGRSGGIRLGRPPEAINIGEVVRHTEDGFEVVDCSTCVIAPVCQLTHALDDAVKAFLAVLDGYTLGDLMVRRDALSAIFARAAQAPA